MKKVSIFALLLTMSVESHALSPLKLEVIGLENDISAVRINNQGKIAYSRYDGISVIGDLHTGFSTFAPVAGYSSLSARITDLNDRGQVTGVAYYNNGVQNIRAAFRAGIGEETRYLANLPHPENFGAGHRINNHGTVVGTGIFTGFLGIGDARETGPLTYWSDANGLAPIQHPTFPGDGRNTINDEGYVSDGGRLGRIGQSNFVTMNGIFSSGGVSKITNGGFVAGISRQTTGGNASLEIWNFAGVRKWSKIFPNYVNPVVIDATDDAKSVLTLGGTGTTFSEPAIWSPLTGTITGVGSLLDSQAASQGWQPTFMSDMNNAGQMVGYATKNGTSYAVLLSPVPEPATLIALGAGIAGILARRQRRLD